MNTPLNEDGNNQSARIQVNDALLNEAESLIWALLDDHIKAEEIKQLESLIREHDQVRQRYLSCVQMHTELQGHFQPQVIREALGNLPKSPVLGSLSDLQPGMGQIPPVIEQ